VNKNNYVENIYSIEGTGPNHVAVHKKKKKKKKKEKKKSLFDDTVLTAQKTLWGNGGIAPLILNLGTSWI
jgi:hypothetical protein